MEKRNGSLIIQQQLIIETIASSSNIVEKMEQKVTLKYGTASSPGTMLFAISGPVKIQVFMKWHMEIKK